MNSQSLDIVEERAQQTARLSIRNYTECGTQKQKGRKIFMRCRGSDTCN